MGKRNIFTVMLCVACLMFIHLVLTFLTEFQAYRNMSKRSHVEGTASLVSTTGREKRRLDDEESETEEKMEMEMTHGWYHTHAPTAHTHTRTHTHAHTLIYLY